MVSIVNAQPCIAGPEGQDFLHPTSVPQEGARVTTIALGWARALVKVETESKLGWIAHGTRRDPEVSR